MKLKIICKLFPVVFNKNENESLIYAKISIQLCYWGYLDPCVFLFDAGPCKFELAMSFKEQLLQLFDDDGMIPFLKFALFCLSPTQLNLNELYLQPFNWFKFSYCFRIGGFRSLSGWTFGCNSAKLKLDSSFIYCSILCLNIFSLGAPLTQKVEQYTSWK